MTLRFLLLLGALLCAIVLSVLGFNLYHVDGEPYLAGWLGLTLTLYIGAQVDR